MNPGIISRVQEKYPKVRKKILSQARYPEFRKQIKTTLLFFFPSRTQVVDPPIIIIIVKIITKIPLFKHHMRNQIPNSQNNNNNKTFIETNACVTKQKPATRHNHTST